MTTIDPNHDPRGEVASLDPDGTSQAASAPRCPFPHLHVGKGVRPEPAPVAVKIPGDDLTPAERVVVKEAYNKSLPWIAAITEAWVQRMCDLDETLFERVLVDFFPEVEDYLHGMLDLAVRNLEPSTERIARESYGALHPDHTRRFQTFEEYATAFLAMGFTACEWQLSKDAFLWVLRTHSPYLEAPERADLKRGEEGAIARFYQTHLIARARACEPGVLLSDAETERLRAYWAGCQSARTQFGVACCRSIFERHPEVITFFQATDMDRLSLHLLDAADLSIRTAPRFWEARSVFRDLGRAHAARRIPPSAYPAVNEHVVETLDHFAPLEPDVRLALQKTMFIVSFLIMQPAVRIEHVEREATQWIEQMAREQGWPTERLRDRLATIRTSIQVTGSYDHTSEEIAYGAQVAWRNSAKCVGRISWNLLKVRDRRHVTTAAGIFQECVEHLRIATEKPNMEAVMTVFAPRRPRERWGPRFWNAQLVRYAGYEEPDGSIVGDPANVELTKKILALGWTPPEPRSPFDVLPVVLELPGQVPSLYQLPDQSVLQVDLVHPTKREFADLKLRWCAVPTITSFNMRLGGVDYVCCPFNGWFMQSEIARNLWERYRVGHAVAGLFGLDPGDSGSLWEDRAWMELNTAVLHSFREARLSMVDHRSACNQFLTHVERERRAGREVPAQWSWVVPAIGGSTLSLWHREMRDFELFPQYRYCCERYLFGEAARGATQSLVVERADPDGASPIEPLRVLILFGSETGTCEGYAVTLLRRLSALRPVLMSLDEAVMSGALTGRDVILVVTSTFGEGKPPSNGVRFDETPLPDLRGTRYAVFAAGSVIYPNYAKYGKRVFARLRDEAHAEPLGDVMLGNELAGQARAFEAFCDILVGRIAPALMERPAAAAASLAVHKVADPSEFVWPPAGGVEGCQRLRVLENRELLQRGTDRSTRLLRFDLTQSAPRIRYTTGDHLKVWPENDPALVEQMCSLLQVSGDDVVDVVDTVTGERARVGFPLPNRVRNILGLYLDLSLRQESFAQLFPALSATCADPIIRSTLRRWIHDCKAPEGGEAAADAIAARYVSIAALLRAFPACRMTLAQAIEVLPKQRPRHYSISSGALQSGCDYAEITVSVVREQTEAGGIRLGLCSNYLNSLRPGVDSAWIGLRESHFRAPADLTCPTLMVGPGTGLAPMMGFLADREHRKRQDEALGEAVLYFGCRNDADFLYGDRLRAYAAQGVLSGLEVAFSRKDGGPKRYTQHVLREQKARVVALLRDPRLHYYVCGDAAMAEQVEETLVQLLTEDGMDRLAAVVHLQTMKAERRFQTDVWGVTHSSMSRVKEAVVKIF